MDRTPKISTLVVVVVVMCVTNGHRPAHAAGGGGTWQVLKESTGVSAMHMQLLHNDKVIFFDRTDFGASNLTLPEGSCRNDPDELALKHDCTAHSAEYDVLADVVRPLTILTDSWCSSGSVAPDGTLVQTGGFNDGERAVRSFRPCGDCDWKEDPSALSVRRWYSTNYLLPEGRQIIVGGRRQYSYEFFPKSDPSSSPIRLPLLRHTRDHVENNLYPFVHLSVDGNLFIFANTRSILLDYHTNKVIRTFPPIPGDDPRNYPSSGSSVLLPLNASSKAVAEVLVCGGAPRGSYEEAQLGNFKRALDTCGRIRITDEDPSWEMETMPLPRVMGDMVLLPTGDEVLLVNGAGVGTAGWEMAHDPTLSPVVYRVNAPPGARFEVQNPSEKPRLYHSSAVLLRDGRVLVGGSNPHVGYSFEGQKYPTELSLEAFSPDYLGEKRYKPRVVASTRNAERPLRRLRYGRNFRLRFEVEVMVGKAGLRVTLAKPAFSTHSFSMNQRMVVLEVVSVSSVGRIGNGYRVEVMAPMDGAIAPPGYYMLFVVNGGVPSEGIWAHIRN